MKPCLRKRNPRKELREPQPKQKQTFRCVASVPNRDVFKALRLAPSEEQIPQVSENHRESKVTMVALESAVTRPRQARTVWTRRWNCSASYANERPFTVEFLLEGAEEPLPLSDESMDTVVMTWACGSRAPLNHRDYQRRSEVTAMSVCLVNTGSALFALLQCVVDGFPSRSRPGSRLGAAL